MAAISIISVVPDTNQPVPFAQPFAFAIEYECLYELREDLEWKMIYVGSAESEQYDQTLDSVLLGPLTPGSFKFVFEGNAPDAGKIPADDLIGVTVVLLTCSYKGAEFIRIGYYVNVDYLDEGLKESPPEVPVLEKLSRTILTDHPRVTRFLVEFDSAGTVPLAGSGEAPMAEGAMGDDMQPEYGAQQQDMQQMQQDQQQQQQQMPMNAGMVF